MAKRKPTLKPSRSPDEIEKRAAVRTYAVALLAVQLSKYRAERLPDEKHRRTLTVGCIRWGLMAWEEEERILNQDQDASERQQFQEQEAVA